MTLEELIKLKSKSSATSFMESINPSDPVLAGIKEDCYMEYLNARKQFIKDNPDDEMCNFINKTSFPNDLQGILSSLGTMTMSHLIEARNDKSTFLTEPSKRDEIIGHLDSLITTTKVAMQAIGKDPREVLFTNDPNIGDRDTVFAIVERMANICKDFKAMQYVNDYRPVCHIEQPETQIDLLNEFEIPYIVSSNNRSFMSDLTPTNAVVHIKNDSDPAGSVAHELGHALYQKNILNRTNIGKLGGCPSLSLHESSSIFFELAIAGFNNEVSNGYHNVKRLTSDKVNYILHIYVRMILEDEIFTDQLETKDIPARWNELVSEHIGIGVANDFDGFMQDVHWFDGAFGYFHSYAIGIFNAVNMLMDVEDQLGVHDLSEDINSVLLPKIDETYGWVDVNTEDIMNKIHPDMEQSFKNFEKFIQTRMTWA